MRKFQLIFLMALVSKTLFAEEIENKTKINPYVYLQFWNMYSEGLSVPAEEQPEPRGGSYFRRGRAGFRGALLDGLTYDLMFSFDYLGKDPYLSSKGTNNKKEFTVWSAYASYRVFPTSERVVVTWGAFLPHLSRESATSPFSVSSLDKAETSCYLRQFVTGKNNGICPGINIGGMGLVGKSQLLYNVACISRQDNVSITTENWSPVFMGHAIWNFGDKEWNSYKYIFRGNALKRQTLFSIGLGASMQGKTDAFKFSSTYGADLLIYLGGLKLEGEYYFLNRRNFESYLGTCMMARFSCNFFLKNDWVVEPVLMFTQFDGDDTFQDALFFDGQDRMADVGINFISAKRKLRLNLHYINRTGNGTKNYRISSNGEYRNYINLGIQVTI